MQRVICSVLYSYSVWDRLGERDSEGGWKRRTDLYDWIYGQIRLIIQ